MKNILIILLALSFTCCKTKPPIKPIVVDQYAALRDSLGNIDTISIERLRIILMEGLPSSLKNEANISTIFIDSISISLDGKYTFEDKVLKLGLIKKDTITVAPGSGKITDVLPYQIGSLLIDKITLTKNGEEVATISKPLKIVKFNIEKYDVQYDAIAPIYDKLSFKIKDLEKRILALLHEIEVLQPKEPDHAARELPPTLNRLLKRVKAIKEHYKAREQTIITESIRVDLAELDNIEYTVEAQEVEVRNPINTPFVIENELLFESGKYDVLTSVTKLDAIVADIQEKIANCRLNYPSMTIKVALAVTGYADEQDVNNDLKHKLYIKYPLEKPTTTKETQESLNRLLSQARADNVFIYIKEATASSSQLTSTTFLQTGAVGKGWLYPVKVNSPCKGDCQQRRVVYISHIVFPE